MANSRVSNRGNPRRDGFYCCRYDGGVAARVDKIGSKLGLYNHGGWGGEPKNLVSVCKELRRRGHDNVGIVYNWHHGHGHIEDWKESLKIMKPYLICLNLNGMNNHAKPKILDLSHGEHDREMFKAILESGYDGPIGILTTAMSSTLKSP